MEGSHQHSSEYVNIFFFEITSYIAIPSHTIHHIYLSKQYVGHK